MHIVRAQEGASSLGAQHKTYACIPLALACRCADGHEGVVVNYVLGRRFAFGFLQTDNVNLIGSHVVNDLPVHGWFQEGACIK